MQKNREFPTIEIDQYQLRQFSDNDLENVYKGLSHPEVIKYYGISFDCLEATKKQIEWFKKIEIEETGIWWAICSKNDRKFLGAGGLNDLDKKNKKAEIGFWLLPENWGRSIMKKVMPQICKYGFEHLELHRIEGFVDTKNLKCKNALAKLDFNYEGTMVDCEYENGSFVSLDIYAIINSKN